MLKPLRPILVARLRRRLSTSGSLGRLAEGLRLARTQGPRAFGSRLSLPSPVEVEQVRQKLLQLLRAYSPSAQVKRLLQACKLLYTALRTQAGMPPPIPSHWPPAKSEAGQPGRGSRNSTARREKNGSSPFISQMVKLWLRKQSVRSPGPAPGCHGFHVAQGLAGRGVGGCLRK